MMKDSSLSNPDFDFELARLVIERGYATKEQIQESMKEQHSLLQQGQEMQLGQILIRKKYLTVAQFLQLIPKKPDTTEVLECAECGAKFNVASKKSGTKLRCKRCQTVLVVPEKSQATVHATVSPAPELSLSKEETIIQNVKPSSKPIPRSTEDETRIQSKNPASKPLGLSSKLPATTGLGNERRFGKYEILEEIARGGMGIVYKARQPDFNRIVALKVLKQGEYSTEEQIARFKREAQSAARLNHPNIIPIHEIGEVEGNYYFTMEYIEGPSLSEWLKDKALPQKKIVKVLKQIASGLEAAHTQQIIHRDLKPANILIDDQGIPKITDFGLAKVLDDQNHLTQSNAVVGTPYYMSPEQTRGESKRIGATSDVYALGVLAYHLLTKRLPFAGNSTMEIYHKINTLPPKPPNEVSPKIDKILSAIVLKAMAKNIEDRYPSAKAFAEDLDRYEAKEKVSAYQETSSKKWIFLLTMSLCLGLGFAGWYGLSLWSRSKVSSSQIGLSEAEKAKKLEEENKRVALEMERAEREKEEQQKREKAQQEEEFNTRLAEGDQLYQRGNYANAIPSYLRCIQLDPKRFDPYFRKGMCHYWLNQGDEAQKAFQEAIRLNSREAEIYYWLGYSCYEQKKIDEALDAFKEAIRYNPNEIRYYKARALIYEKKQNWTLAVADYKTMLKLNPKDADAYFELGAIYTFRKKDMELAIDFYTQCLAINPEKLIARYNRGVCFALQKKFELAFKDFNDSYEQDPDKVHQLVEQSLSREQNSSEFGYTSVEVDNLIDELYKSMDMSKPDPRNFLYVGIYHFYRNDFKKAAQILSISIQMNPDDDKPKIFRALCYTKLEDYDKAIRDFSGILKKKPDDIYTRLYLGEVYLQMKQYSKAFIEYERVMKEDQDNVRALHKIGFIHLLNNEFSEAMEKFERCIKYNSNYPYAHSLKGYILMKQNRFAEAIAAVNIAIGIDSHNAYHWGMLGEIEWAQGNSEKAKETLKKTLSLNPNDHHFSKTYYEKLLESIP